MAMLLAAMFFGLTDNGFAQVAAAPKRTILEVLWRWAPLLLWGFCFNLIISAGAMAIGTGACAISDSSAASRERSSSADADAGGWNREK